MTLSEALRQIPRLPRLARTLRWRLVLIICVIITVILFGQAILGLSGEVTELDTRVNTRGTIMAQSAAAAAEGLMEGTDPQRFSSLFRRVSQSVELVEAMVLDRQGIILGATDNTQVGTIHDRPITSAFGLHPPTRGLAGLFEGTVEYNATAPVLRGDRVIGFVHLTFRSDEVSRRAIFILVATGAWALLWLVVGATAATLYVRHITGPLAKLTEAASALSNLSDDDFDAASLTPVPSGEGAGDASDDDEVTTLQRAFVNLVEGLRAERAENKRLMGTLQGMNEHLRERVDEVTADLRDANVHLEAIIGSLTEGVVSCSAERGGDRCIVRINEAARAHLDGLSRPEIGDEIGALLPDSAERLRALFDEVHERGRPESLEVELPAAEGRTAPRQLVIRASPLIGKGRTPEGVVLTIVDETERRRIEGQMRRNDRLISLGTLAAGLAHELGNHMHIIHGFSNILLRSLPADDPNREDAVAIHEENSRAVHLLKRFLQFARPDEGVYVNADLSALVHESLGFSRVELKAAGVKVVEALAEDLPAVSADTKLLQQVFINLMLNAADAMRERETRVLTVRTRRAADDPDTVELDFEDTGCGISAAAVDRIFDPFFTTKATGTGLGLSIAHQVITSHHGKLSVRSEPGRGTTFTVRLPAAPVTPEAATRTDKGSV